MEYFISQHNVSDISKREINKTAEKKVLQHRVYIYNDE